VFSICISQKFGSHIQHAESGVTYYKIHYTYFFELQSYSSLMTGNNLVSDKRPLVMMLGSTLTENGGRSSNRS
jgi:hypothetical protein